MRRVLDYSLAFLVLVTLLIVTVNVALRYIFNSGFAWSEEVARFLFLYLVFVGAVAALRDREHMRVTIVIDALKPNWSSAFRICSSLIAVGLGVLLTHGSFTLVELTSASTAPATGLPLSWIYGLGIAVGLSIIVFSIRDALEIIRGREPNMSNEQHSE